MVFEESYPLARLLRREVCERLQMEIEVGENVDSVDVDVDVDVDANVDVDVNAYPLFPACPNAVMICEMIDSSVMRDSGGRRRITGGGMPINTAPKGYRNRVVYRALLS